MMLTALRLGKVNSAHPGPMGSPGYIAGRLWVNQPDAQGCPEDRIWGRLPMGQGPCVQVGLPWLEGADFVPGGASCGLRQAGGPSQGGGSRVEVPKAGLRLVRPGTLGLHAQKNPLAVTLDRTTKLALPP